MTTRTERDEFLGLNALSDMFVNLSSEYEKEGDSELREDVLKQALELNPQSADAMEALAIYYEISERDPLKAEEFYLQALENDPENRRILYNFGNFYEENKNYPNMLKYYNAAGDLNDSDAFFQIAKYYLKVEKNRQLMLECYLKGIECSNDDEYDEDDDVHYSKKYSGFNHFDLQEILESVKQPTEKLILTLNKLKRKKDISVYNNKVRLFERLHNVQECQICYEDKINIDLHCGHEVCTDCYKQVYNKCCPWCRTASYFKGH